MFCVKQHSDGGGGGGQGGWMSILSHIWPAIAAYKMKPPEFLFLTHEDKLKLRNPEWV